MPFSICSPVPKLAEYSAREVKEYYEWVLRLVPERLAALAEEVRSTPGFSAWNADLTRASLEQLGDWFEQSVTTRARTPFEMAELKARFDYRVDIPDYELTEQTFSKCYDVGIYFAEVLRKECPCLQWGQVSGAKKNVLYGHAALIGFGKIDFSPIHISTTIAYGIGAGHKNKKRLAELFDVWSTIARNARREKT